MAGYIEGRSRDQATLFPERLDDLIAADAAVRVVDAFVGTLRLGEFGFAKAAPKATGRPGYAPADLLKLYVYGYLNQIRSRPAGAGMPSQCRGAVAAAPAGARLQDHRRFP